MDSRVCSVFAGSNLLFPICLDAAPYSLPCRDHRANEYTSLLHSVMCMGIVLYLRPNQRMLVLCSSKMDGNISRVAQVLEKLLPKNRKRVLVLVNDGIHKHLNDSSREDTPEDVDDACKRTAIEFQSPALASVEKCYTISRASKRTSEFVAQIAAIVRAHRDGTFDSVGLGMHKRADFQAAARIFMDSKIPIRFVIVSKRTEEIDDIISWAVGRNIQILTYEDTLHTNVPITRIVSTRCSLTHTRIWINAVAMQPAHYLPAKKPVIDEHATK